MKYTLLLNQTYEPINVLPARRATVKMLTDVVYVEAFYPESEGLRTAGGDIIPVPSVVRLKRYINFNSFVDKEVVSRKDIYYRDNHKCGYCGKELFKAGTATLDHIIPKSRGGRHTKANLLSCCRKCNNFKSDRTPSEAGMKMIYPESHLRQNIHLLRVKESAKVIPDWSKYLK